MEPTRRRFATGVAALAGFLVTGVGLSAPPPREKPRGTLYFPTKVGAKWVYDIGGDEETHVVTAAVKKDGAYTVTVRRTDVSGRETEFDMKVGDDGLFQLTGLAVKHPPSHLVKLPHTPGGRWETYTGAFGSPKSTITAHGPEEVDVPAGKFEAIRVETNYWSKGPGGPVLQRAWYAPGVGLVKREYGEYVRTLKSFTPGKE